MQASKQPLIALSTLMQLEGMAREAQTLKELQFLAVNETRRLVTYRQAFIFKTGLTDESPYRAVAASSVAAIERNAPLIQWLERMVHSLRKKHKEDAPVQVTEADCPDGLKADWKEFSSPYVLWCPLRLPDKTWMGAIWLSRETPWEENEFILLKRLAETYAHAWKALLGRKKPKLRGRVARVLTWAIPAVVVAAMFLPVRLSTLAPAKVVPTEPAIVSAPMDGVVADILVLPNTMVTEGQTLLTFEDTNYRNQYEIAEKSLAVALAEYHKASQSAFLDPESKGQVPLLKAEAELRGTERDYAKELLDQVDVKAARAGLLMYTDKSDWIGRPVVVGERIMEIADPKRMEIQVDLPVDDAIVLKEGALVKVFLDADPLDTHDAMLKHASYHAQMLPGDILAYRVTAELADANPDIRIGWEGTAKIYGDNVSLFFLLFRRPLSAVRQFLGL